MSNDKSPKVSIGLPVYNGEKYLEEAINSILAQTFPDFELIISDNASTDHTEEICKRYAAMDARIRYYRNEINIGVGNNHNLTFKLSKGQYFRWAGHDDLVASELLAKCVSVLDQDPSVVLCHSIVEEIDEQGQGIKCIDQDKARSTKPHERFCELTSMDHNCETMYGLIRSDMLCKTALHRSYTDSDRTLICELSLYGKFYRVPEILFFKRIHSGCSTSIFPDWRSRMAVFRPGGTNEFVLPYWMQLSHYLESIARSPIGFREHVLCYMHMVKWITQDRRWRKLGKDVVLVLKKMFAYLLSI